MGMIYGMTMIMTMIVIYYLFIGKLWDDNGLIVGQSWFNILVPYRMV